MANSQPPKSGIYQLIFPSGHYYVGQARDFNERSKEHIRSLKSNTHFNYRVQNEYCVHGEPTFKVLKECSLSELNEIEHTYINLDNPLCLNILSARPNQHRGENSPRAKYSNAEILNSILYLVDNPKAKHSTVAELFNIDISTIHDISAGRGRLLEFTETRPDLVQKVISNKAHNTRGLRSITITNGQEIVTLTTGQYSEFCRTRGIHSSNLAKVISGSRGHTGGWKLVK